jgi:hypothetical protein
VGKHRIQILGLRSVPNFDVILEGHFYKHTKNVYKNDPNGARTRDLGVPYVSLTSLVYTLYKHHALTN